MADERKIVIELKATGSDDSDETQADNEKTAKKRDKALKTIYKRVLSTEMKIVEDQFFYQWGKYTNLSENYKAAVLMNNVKTTIAKVKSLAGSVIEFAKLGSMALPGAGTVAGAVLGAVVDGGVEAVSLWNQYRDQSLQLAMGDKTAAYARSRLGLIDNGRGTQN